MALESTDWLLDPEMLIKAYYMNVRILELNVFARMRGSGLSHVRASTCWAFFWQLLQFRFAGGWRRGARAGSGRGSGLRVVRSPSAQSAFEPTAQGS